MWLAGGGVKPGITIGSTDELGYYAVEDRVHVHDLQATILHLLGLDHTEAHLPLPGPRLPPDRRRRQGRRKDPRLSNPASHARTASYRPSAWRLRSTARHMYQLATERNGRQRSPWASNSLAAGSSRLR